jgi:homoserine O-succinyltransferase/O-acetyltransferase
MPFLPTHKPGALQIGLVNNMPDAALARTEQQFLDVLAAAVPDRAINLHMFHIPGVPRGELGRSHLSSHHYRDAADLRLAGLDGLIVTGTEPRQANLKQEPYWLAFARMFDWIAERGPSTIFSCLAAHAAVLHYDGIERQRLAAKRFGLFAHSVAGPHSLTQHLPEIFAVSHSRWNEVSNASLSARGYRILTESHDAGADLFWRNARKPQFFFQGHPEYDSRTLFREYRRDVLRYLMGEHEAYPRLPESYFSAGETALLSEFQDRALEKRNTALMPSFPVSSPEIVASGEEAPAPVLYRAWLSQIAEPFVERRSVPRAAGAR